MKDNNYEFRVGDEVETVDGMSGKRSTARTVTRSVLRSDAAVVQWASVSSMTAAHGRCCQRAGTGVTARANYSCIKSESYENKRQERKHQC